MEYGLEKWQQVVLIVCYEEEENASKDLNLHKLIKIYVKDDMLEIYYQEQMLFFFFCYIFAIKI